MHSQANVRSSNLYYQFTYDPEGNLVQRQQTQNTSAYATDTAFYDAYGARRADISAISGGAAPRFDPIGFGGQWGYYTDTETGLVNLTHRYYDPTAGRFLTRDPIGYRGGINLYGFAGNNPVNEIDSSGFAPPPCSKSEHRLFRWEPDGKEQEASLKETKPGRK